MVTNPERSTVPLDLIAMNFQHLVHREEKRLHSLLNFEKPPCTITPHRLNDFFPAQSSALFPQSAHDLCRVQSVAARQFISQGLVDHLASSAERNEPK